MTTNEKELLAVCDDILEHKFMLPFWPVATELKRRIEQSSERANMWRDMAIELNLAIHDISALGFNNDVTFAESCRAWERLEKAQKKIEELLITVAAYEGDKE